MDLGISGRRAAVAAGSAGLGLGTAVALAAEGVRVAICGRDPERLQAALAAIDDGAISGAVAIEADLSDPLEAERFVAAAADALDGPVDILVANAGGPPHGSATAADLDAYRAAFELNALSTIAMCRAAVDPMRAAGWGRVLAITSIGAREPIPDLAASSVARAAVTSFVKSLAAEVAADGVTVNSIQPGTHDTERIRALGGSPAARAAAIPVGRMGDPTDFGQVAAFLCSQPANFITGTSVLVDGGVSRSL